MNDYLVQIEGAIRATTIHSPTEFFWFRRRSPQIVRRIRRELTARTARNYLLYNLQSKLYHDFYCRGVASPDRSEWPSASSTAGTPFVEQLSVANAGKGCWEDDWEVQGIEHGMIAAQRGGLALLAAPGDCLVSGGGAPVQHGRVSLRFPKENRAISPGFYTALGDRSLSTVEPGNPVRLVRFYWHLGSPGAVPFIRSATLLLNSAGIPFRLKVVNHAEGFNRCDAGVLYISKEDYGRVAALLGQIYMEVAANLRQSVPAFTRQLALGLGLAEDPGDGDSFGLHRCRLLAEGIVRAHEHGDQSVGERLQRVVTCFDEAGISLEAPFLCPGSSDVYALPNGFREMHAARRSTGRGATHKSGSTYSYLETAHSIGRQLVREAIWHDNLCNWVGAEMPSGSYKDGPPRTTYAALGPDIYTGTAGVALFLAQLYAVTGDASLRRIALGAIRQALSRFWILDFGLWNRHYSYSKIQNPKSKIGGGFYTGRMGIAVSAARVGLLTGQDGLVESGGRLAQRCAQEYYDGQHNGHGYDLLTGSAGAILACLLLEKMVGDPSLIGFAARLGDDLLQAADKRGPGYSWEQIGSKTRRRLTGFSHGAAGIGYALLELWQATGEARYREGAEYAFAYERSWFNPAIGNWPDFRFSARSRTGGRKHPDGGDGNQFSHAAYWCHGAPGIALSRLRAYSLLNDTVYKEEAQIALRTTHQVVEAALASGLGNFSLCHGLAGNAEVLLYGRQSLEKESDGQVELARTVADTGIERYASAEAGSDSSWPCGVGVGVGGGNGQSPGLMLGLAGIGYFYLRLHSLSTPGILLLQGAEWGRVTA